MQTAAAAMEQRAQRGGQGERGRQEVRLAEERNHDGENEKKQQPVARHSNEGRSRGGEEGHTSWAEKRLKGQSAAGRNERAASAAVERETAAMGG